MGEKLKSYAVQLLIVTGGCMIALWGFQQINKPRIAPPATSTTTQ